MKSKLTEFIQLNSSNKPTTRRHSGRLFKEDDSLNKSNRNDYDNYLEHDSSSSVSLSSLANTATATTSFLASSTTNENLCNEVLSASTPTTTKKNQTNSRTNFNSKASELFRTDFITAMKLGTECLTEETCMRIADTWKMEWDKGVQVPNNKYLTKPTVTLNKNFSGGDEFEDEYETENDIFPSKLHSMPTKLVCQVDDKNFDPKIHEGHLLQRLTNIQNKKLTDCLIATSKYEYDETDDIWLTKVNDQFARMGLTRLNHIKFEKIIENFENQSFEMLKNYLDKLCLYKIEYDPTVVCDVCRSPDSEPTNEIVFCDGCNVCVHQNCYGIEQIPEGNWLCAACDYGGPRPECCLCPNKGGALKPTKDYKQWCHVACVLWTPEVTFGNTDKYEPVINLSKIPTEKWMHKCSLCKYRKGCCVECSSLRCSNSFHITCAFKHNLKTIESTNDDGLIEFSCLCKKHSKLRRSETKANETDLSMLLNTTGLDVTLSEDISISEEKFHLAIQSMNEADRKTEIIKRLEILYHKFYYKVSVEKTISDLELSSYAQQIKMVFNYWKLKRRFNQQHNKPLISFRADKPIEFNTHAAETNSSLSLKSSLFLDVRHRLEYLRNLCFIIKKREKKKEKYFELNRKYFNKLTEYLEKYKTPTTTVSSNSKQTNSSETWSSCRIRDMLQTKNENIIYDMPEKWQLFDQHLRSVLDTSCVSFNQNVADFQIENESTSKSVNPTSRSGLRTTRSKSVSNNQMNESIKDISINVLNNNTNVETNKMSKTNTTNSKQHVLSNCENNESVNTDERRLLRSFSVYSDSSRKNLEIKLDSNEFSNEKTRLSLPNAKRSSSIMSLNSTKSKNSIKSDSFSSNEELKNPVKNVKKNTITTPTSTTNLVNRTKKRPNQDSNLIPQTITKRPRYNEPITSDPMPPPPPPQTRFNLRTKIEK